MQAGKQTPLTIELNEARTQVESARLALQSQQDERTQVEKAVHDARQSLSSLLNKQGSLQARLAERQAQAQRQEQAFSDCHP